MNLSKFLLTLVSIPICGLLTPLYKKGDPYSENNYRGTMVN